jgi:hypothetical protein
VNSKPDQLCESIENRSQRTDGMSRTSVDDAERRKVATSVEESEDGLRDGTLIVC